MSQGGKISTSRENFFFDGVTLTATTWVDASYEGELADIAGADMVWGREVRVCDVCVTCVCGVCVWRVCVCACAWGVWGWGWGV